MAAFLIDLMIYGSLFTFIGLALVIFIFAMTYDPLSPFLEEKLAEREARRSFERDHEDSDF